MKNLKKISNTVNAQILEKDSGPYLNRVVIVSRILVVMIAINMYRAFTAWINALIGLGHCSSK